MSSSFTFKTEDVHPKTQKQPAVSTKLTSTLLHRETLTGESSDNATKLTNQPSTSALAVSVQQDDSVPGTEVSSLDSNNMRDRLAEASEEEKPSEPTNQSSTSVADNMDDDASCDDDDSFCSLDDETIMACFDELTEEEKAIVLGQMEDMEQTAEEIKTMQEEAQKELDDLNRRLDALEKNNREMEEREHERRKGSHYWTWHDGKWVKTKDLVLTKGQQGGKGD